jgi:hypothetical protein
MMRIALGLVAAVLWTAAGAQAAVPGTSAQTTSAGRQLQATAALPALQPSSTYVAENATVPAAAMHTITTGSNTRPDVVASATKQKPAVLVASVTPAGKTSLRLGGHPVKTLKAGRYEVKPAKGRRFVFSGNGRRITVAKPRKVTFTAGPWTLSTLRSSALPFRVQ